jgi:hypothetical protein
MISLPISYAINAITINIDKVGITKGKHFLSLITKNVWLHKG